MEIVNVGIRGEEGLIEFNFGSKEKPVVSVVMPTKRYGNVYPILFRGLGNHEFDDSFEVLIVDDLSENQCRRDEVEVFAKQYSLNVKFMAGKTPHWKSNRNIACARNTALIYATGELIVFFDDYTWVPPSFLDQHLRLYEMTGYCLIGAVTAVKFVDYVPEDFTKLPIHTLDRRAIETPGIKPEGAVDHRTVLGYKDWKNCPPGWFYCSNASAPLKKIIEVNGFDEEMDCTSEEDLDLGIRLGRVNCKFWFKSNPEVVAYHMAHGKPEINPPKLYSEEECHRVTKGMYNDNEGSWAVLKRNSEREPWRVNEGYFNLKEERIKIGNWV